MDEESEKSSTTQDEGLYTKKDDDVTKSRKPLAASAVKDVKALSKKTPTVELSKEESKEVSSKIWARVFRHYEWVTLAILGGMGFGAVFPGLLYHKYY